VSRPIRFGELNPERRSSVKHPGTTRAALVSGSPSPASKSRALLQYVRERLSTLDIESSLVDLAALPADALLGRRPDTGLRAALEAVAGAQLVVAGSPVYRATYSGLLKVFFDLLPAESLAGKIAVSILTGGGPAHQLALEHGLRPLFASLGAVVAGGVYAWDGQFRPNPEPAVLARLERVVDDAVALLRAGPVATLQA
jgi:FMN reductase